MSRSALVRPAGFVPKPAKTSGRPTVGLGDTQNFGHYTARCRTYGFNMALTRKVAPKPHRPCQAIIVLDRVEESGHRFITNLDQSADSMITAKRNTPRLPPLPCGNVFQCVNQERNLLIDFPLLKTLWQRVTFHSAECSLRLPAFQL
jgi:hypothetical protein